MPVTGLSDAQAENSLAVRFRGTAHNAPATYYWGASTTIPTDKNGTGLTEVTEPDYGRKAVTKNTTNFTAPSGRSLENAVDITIILAVDHTEDWGTIRFIPFYDAPTGGNYVGGYRCRPKPAGPGTDVICYAGEFVASA